MTLNTSDEEIIADRRHRVARLRLRGATQREIAHTLACSLGTVNGDLAALRQEWRDVAASDIADHQARVLAELHEARRVAWAQPAAKGLPMVLQSLKQECTLLGLDLQSPIVVEQRHVLSEPERVTRLIELLDAARARAAGQSVIDVSPEPDDVAD